MRRTETVLIWMTRMLLVVLAGAGITYLLYPEETLRYYTDLGTPLGSFPTPSLASSGFWVSLSFAYMVLVAAFCFLAQLDIRRNWRMYGLLAVGKLSSSGTAAAFFLREGAFIYLATIVTDGLIAVFAIVAYYLMSRMGKSPSAGAPP